MRALPRPFGRAAPPACPVRCLHTRSVLPGMLWFRSPDVYVSGGLGICFFKRMRLMESKISIVSLHVKTQLGDSKVEEDL